MINRNRQDNISSNQANILTLIVLIFFSSIIGRLFWLQIIKGSFYRTLSEENRIRLVSNPPIRGKIITEDGKLLADNKLRYALIAQPHLIGKKELPDLIKRLSILLKVNPDALNLSYQKGVLNNDFSIELLTSLTNTQVLHFNEHESIFPGFQVNTELIRYYPNGNFASHVLGYTQLITFEEFKNLSSQGYKIKDVIGRSGLEAVFERHLRGKWGGEMLEVDAAGNIQRSIGYQPPLSGNDLQLTLDFNLQKAAEKALEGKSAGAIVVLEPNTGAIKAMASRPGFDPNFFTKSIRTQKEFDEIFLSSKRPLLSRALNAYDPGSTWKIVTGMAGMESGKFKPNVRLKTASCIKYGSHCFPEHNRKGWGEIGFEDAFRVSSNTFFYQIGVAVGIEQLYDSAIKLGFNNRTGVETSLEESRSFVGNKDWASAGRGWGRPGTTPWIPEDIASASIGQAVVQVTPLQLARAYAVFANGGYLITPHLVHGNIDWQSPKYRQKVDIELSTLQKIREGLRKVAISGTARSFKMGAVKLPPIAAKTGTAEDSTGGSDHAWFACFSPYESTQIVVVAFAQNTPGGGSVHALPMARDVLTIWHQDQ